MIGRFGAGAVGPVVRAVGAASTGGGTGGVATGRGSGRTGRTGDACWVGTGVRGCPGVGRNTGAEGRGAGVSTRGVDGAEGRGWKNGWLNLAGRGGAGAPGGTRGAANVAGGAGSVRGRSTGASTRGRSTGASARGRSTGVSTRGGSTGASWTDAMGLAGGGTSRAGAGAAGRTDAGAAARIGADPGGGLAAPPAEPSRRTSSVAAQTVQRARTPSLGTFAGSTRNTVRQDGQRTFMFPSPFYGSGSASVRRSTTNTEPGSVLA